MIRPYRSIESTEQTKHNVWWYIKTWIIAQLTFMQWARRYCGGRWQRVLISGYDSDYWSGWSQVSNDKDHPLSNLALEESEIQREDWGEGTHG